MRIISILILVLLLVPVQATELPLMPYPQKIEFAQGQRGVLVLDKQWHLAIVANQPQAIKPALSEFANRIKKHTGQKIRWKKSNPENAELVIRVTDTSSMSYRVKDWNETYRLHISSTQVELEAAQLVGVLRGLQTLLQLVDASAGNIQLPVVAIEDAPRFKWRGLLLDTSRHFFSVETIKRQLDAMAAAKYNIFHWHLTDDQGWRFESKHFPKLHRLASDGEYYTHKQIREIVRYAQARGIQVLPEIDMPGHASAIAVAYPELMSAPGPYAMEYRWGVHKATLNPANEKVYEFVDGLVAELVDLFPFEYIHIGGDEVDPEHWNSNADIQAFMQERDLKDHRDLQAHFNQRVQTILRKHNRKMIGWDEIQHPDLSKDIVIQSWQGPDGVSDAVSHGFEAILSTGFYLDQPQTAAYHYRNDPVPPKPYTLSLPVANEFWQSWRFEMPRKRGKPIAGIFTLIGTEKTARGFIDFVGKSRREVFIHSYIRSAAKFSLDTWMGPVTFDVKLDQAGLHGSALVGNAPYRVSGEQIAGSSHANKQLPEAKAVKFLQTENEALILGGEAALWAEIVDENSIDLRLWPRAFVVAERLWSPRDLRDEASLYSRIETTMGWARKSVGIKDLQQHQQALRRLVGGGDPQPLAIMAEALEPAHYYHRQHEKSARETYSKSDRLDRLVDALPAENRLGVTLLAWVDAWTINDDKQAARALRNQFERWLENDAQLQALILARTELKALKNLADNIKNLSALAIQILDYCESGNGKLPQVDNTTKTLLQDARELDQEMVISLLPAVQKMVHSVALCS